VVNSHEKDVQAYNAIVNTLTWIHAFAGEIMAKMPAETVGKNKELISRRSRKRSR